MREHEHMYTSQLTENYQEEPATEEVNVEETLQEILSTVRPEKEVLEEIIEHCELFLTNSSPEEIAHNIKQTFYQFYRKFFHENSDLNPTISDHYLNATPEDVNNFLLKTLTPEKYAHFLVDAEYLDSLEGEDMTLESIVANLITEMAEHEGIIEALETQQGRRQSYSRGYANP